MGQDRISDMAILSVEHTLVNTLNINELIEDFSGKKARKIAIKMLLISKSNIIMLYLCTYNYYVYLYFNKLLI